MATRNRSDHERSAAGLDFDSPIRDRAASLGQAMAEGGPQALFDELENLLPEEWQEHIRTFPLVAVLLGVGVGVYLGMKKSEELISAGAALVSAAAMANVSKIIDRKRD
ncbi:MAG: hypothetical protein ACXW3E_11835 [Thermoanaerobaculia bacterium]